MLGSLEVAIRHAVATNLRAGDLKARLQDHLASAETVAIHIVQPAG
jgi:hypothetical protein